MSLFDKDIVIHES